MDHAGHSRLLDLWKVLNSEKMDHFNRSRSSSWWIARIRMEITDVVED